MYYHYTLVYQVNIKYEQEHILRHVFRKKLPIINMKIETIHNQENNYKKAQKKTNFI